MAYGQFKDVDIIVGEDGARELHVTGITPGDPPGACVAHHVAVQQGDAAPVHGGCELKPGGWAAVAALDAGDLAAGDALAIGTETYYSADPTPSFVTGTWAQIVCIKVVKDS